MNVFQYILLFIISYLCIYALINRVCQCIEHCATAKAYGKFRETGANIKMEDLNKKVGEGFRDVKENA